MKILDIITEAPGTMTQAEIDVVVAAWKKQNPEAVAKLGKTDPLLGGPLGGKSAGAQRLLRTAIGIAPLIELNINLYALEQVASQPLATFQQSNPKFASFSQADQDQYIKQMRDMYYGLWMTATLIPILAKWLLKGTPVVNSLFDMLEGYAGRIPGKAGGFVRLAATLIIPVFVGWLQSPPGIEWLAGTVFMPIIRMGGTGVAWTWDKIWPKIQEWTGIPLDKINPVTQTAVDNDRGSGYSGFGLQDPYEFANQSQQMGVDQAANKLKRGAAGIVPGT